MIKQHIIPLALILSVFLVTLVTNFYPNASLMGWDNLLPELGFKFNIQRSIFSVWEEYQGLGLLAGNGHAASLIHQLLLLAGSIILPDHLLRWTYTFAMLLTGGVGLYFLSLKLLSINSKETIHKHKNIIAASLGAVFYMLNLATIQTFYVPFEPFITQFGLLPFLLLSAYNFTEKQSRKNFLLLLLVNIIAIPQGQVPTVFIVYFLTLITLLLIICRNLKSRIAGIKVLVLTIIVNSFWLLPFIYFTLTNSSVAVNAKINQIATGTVLAQNREFGNLLDVILLKGFWFNNVDPDLSGVSRFMLLPWKEHFQNPFVISLGIIFFLVIAYGIIISLLKRKRVNIAFSTLFLVSFTLLAIDTFPFSFINSLIREIPLVNQVFRFPFTKFSILLALCYSIFFAYGIRSITAFATALSKKFIFVITPMVLIMIMLYAFPVFKGNLIYSKEKIQIPAEYNRTFEYFINVDPNLRIANLPQHTFWGWSYYSWGYGGSGFLWYGIKQPILDRAFDVWSAPLENYYYELSYALYSQNEVLFEKVLNKYQVSYLLLDKNVISPSSPKSLFYKETESLISKIPSISKDAVFGNIEIYKVKLRNNPKNFLYSTPILPSSNGYAWGNNDLVYQNLGDYKVSEKPDAYNPFPSLFSNKLLEHNFTISETESNITLSANIPKGIGGNLYIPAFADEKLLPIEIRSRKDDSNNTVISAHFLLPTITLDNKSIQNENYSYPLFIIPETDGIFSIGINGMEEKEFELGEKLILRGNLLLENDNFVTLRNLGKDDVLVQSIAKSYLNDLSPLDKRIVKIDTLQESAVFSITVPKVFDLSNAKRFEGNDFRSVSNCNVFRNGEVSALVTNNNVTLSSVNDTLCTSAYSATLTHNEGYLLSLSSKNIEGNPLHFWVFSESTGFAPIDINLEKEKNKHYFFIPPMEKYGQSYSFHADNDSIGKSLTKNTLDNLEVINIPYNFISNLRIESPKAQIGKSLKLSSTHPNESLYTVELEKSPELTTLILSQSYDPGWKAYEFEVRSQKSKVKSYFEKALPFIFGKELRTHIKVNNWENGWQTTGGKEIVIVYLPQYLQYLGFFTIFLALILTPLITFREKLNTYFESKTIILQSKISEIFSKQNR